MSVSWRACRLSIDQFNLTGMAAPAIIFYISGRNRRPQFLSLPLFGRALRPLFDALPPALGRGECDELYVPLEPDFGPDEGENR